MKYNGSDIWEAQGIIEDNVCSLEAFTRLCAAVDSASTFVGPADDLRRWSRYPT